MALEAVRVFEAVGEGYDEWYRRNVAEALSEALLVKSLGLPKPIIEIGAGTGWFSSLIGASLGVEPAEAMARFFERMAGKGAAAPGLLSHIASHPDLAARAAAARAADVIGERPFRPALSPAQWRALKTICG